MFDGIDKAFYTLGFFIEMLSFKGDFDTDIEPDD